MTYCDALITLSQALILGIIPPATYKYLSESISPPLHSSSELFLIELANDVEREMLHRILTNREIPLDRIIVDHERAKSIN